MSHQTMLIYAIVLWLQHVRVRFCKGKMKTPYSAVERTGGVLIIKWRDVAA